MVKQLERDVPYHTFYFNPTNGKRYELGTVAMPARLRSLSRVMRNHGFFEDRFDGTGN